ncbi:MAG TPA: hypothetical protein VIV11_00875 [Kofleriaceae bacterium]
MRRLLLVLVVAACGAPKATGPKWPEPSKTADDGGESIEPHPSATYAAAIEKSADTDEKPAEATVATPAAAASDDKPATATPSISQPVIDEVITTEEIIIEIED